MTERTEARIRQEARGSVANAMEHGASRRTGSADEPTEAWIAPEARERSGEVWIGPDARALASLRPLRVSRLLRGRWREERMEEASPDARMDARFDARAGQFASIEAAEPGSGDQIQTIHGYADAFHPHGEALGPGAQRLCTEREKNAFGGAHPHDHFEQRWHYGRSDAC